MKKIITSLILALITTVAYNQTDSTYQLSNSQKNYTHKIDSVYYDFELTPIELASFKILNDNNIGEAQSEITHLISYDMFQTIENARSRDENVIINYENYTILVYRKSLEQEVKQ